MKYLIVLFLIVFLICFGCEGTGGPAGPEGSQGPAGPEGSQGPAGEDLEIIIITGTLLKGDLDDFFWIIDINYNTEKCILDVDIRSGSEDLWFEPPKWFYYENFIIIINENPLGDEIIGYEYRIAIAF